jgi:hypothetical protein
VNQEAGWAGFDTVPTERMTLLSALKAELVK